MTDDDDDDVRCVVLLLEDCQRVVTKGNDDEARIWNSAVNACAASILKLAESHNREAALMKPESMVWLSNKHSVRTLRIARDMLSMVKVTGPLMAEWGDG